MERVKERPCRALQFLAWFCPLNLVEGISGDLAEQYQEDLKTKNEWRASIKLWWHVIQFFRLEIILRNKLKPIFSMMLWKNYLRIAFRHLSLNKGYSSINIFGLGIGLACSLVIFLFVYGEWSYNKGFQNSERVYRIGISFFNIGKFAAGPEALLDVLPKEFAGIETATRIQKGIDQPVTVGSNTSYQTIYFTDTAYFKIFDYSFLEGTSQKALSGLYDAILTKDLAIELFSKTDVVGETLLIGKEKVPYTITAVVNRPSFNTHFKTDLWLSNQSKITGSPVWTSASFHNYVLLKENVSESSLWEGLNSVFEHHVFPESGKMMGFKTLEDYQKNDISVKFYVHPLHDIYLKSKLSYDLSPGGNEENIYIFSGIAVFILGLAVINFINLTTARASRRAKEVAIRKSLGTSRGSLVNQFLVGSMLTSTLALVVAILLAEGFLFAFHLITGKVLLNTIWQSPIVVVVFVLFGMAIGLFSGLYPSMVLTSFRAIKVLKGDTGIKAGSTFRNGLVVFQFSVSVLLIISSLVIQQQIQFIKTKDLGFDQENVITVEKAGLLKQSVNTFQQELSELPGVVKSSLHTGEPGSNRVTLLATYSVQGMEHPISIATYYGDQGFLGVNGMRLIQGRNFSENLAADSLGVIVNEATLKTLGIEGDPIGSTINNSQVIIGVVSNFHWQTLRNEIAPLIILPQYKKEFYELSFKVEPTSVSAFLNSLTAAWKKFMPEEPLKYHFLDENFAEMAENESVLERMILFFTTLAILISCLGLLGLSAYTAEERTKEIGIRKVLGASAFSIVYLLNRKFTLLILLALVISIPAAIYCINWWLNGFAYRVSLNVFVFIAGSVIALAMAWLTVAYHAWRATTVNPTETLKYE